MPYTDDTDRHCPHCHGRRKFTDSHPGQPSVTWCICVTHGAPEAAQPGPDALMDEAVARLAAAAGVTAQAYRAQLFADDWARR